MMRDRPRPIAGGRRRVDEVPPELLGYVCVFTGRGSGTPRAFKARMLATAHAACLIGIEAHPVQVEVRLGEGLPGFDIVGLPERGVRESRIRVRAALSSIGFAFPPRHLVLNLAPGDLPKTGAGLDLAIAASILAACEGVSTDQLSSTLLS